MDSDTVKLLRECSQGLKTGIGTLDNVVDSVEDKKLSDLLKGARRRHDEMITEAEVMLAEHRSDGKEPNPIAVKMAEMKCGATMLMKPSDASCAKLVAEGCDMGSRSISMYLNQYSAADVNAKAFAERIIRLEDSLSESLREYM